MEKMVDRFQGLPVSVFKLAVYKAISAVQTRAYSSRLSMREAACVPVWSARGQTLRDGACASAAVYHVKYRQSCFEDHHEYMNIRPKKSARQ